MINNAHNMIWELPRKLNDLAMPMDVPAIRERVRQFFKESMAAWSRLAESSLERNYLRDWDWVAFKSYRTGERKGGYRRRLINATYDDSKEPTTLSGTLLNSTFSTPLWLSCLRGRREVCITRICPGEEGPWSKENRGKCYSEEFQIVNNNGELNQCVT